MHALVTGANGFIGAHLVRLLLERGHDVRAMVRRSSDVSRLAGTSPRFVYADVTDPASLETAVADVDVVFHLAGSIAAMSESRFAQVNCTGTENLLRAFQDHNAGVARFVFASSIAAGGPSEFGAARTEEALARPVSAYGRSKLAAEEVVTRCRGSLPTTIIRPPIVYGSGDTATLDLFRAVKRRVAIAIRGPERRVSFVHVEDLLEGVLLAATHEAAVGETFALPGPEDATMLEFQQIIGAVMGRRPLAIPVPAAVLRLAGRVADVAQRWSGTPGPFGSDKAAEALEPGWVVSGEKARRLLGFVPHVRLREGLDEAVSWYTAHGWL